MRAWIKNLPSFHHRIMANFLKKRGWVVFYLKEEARHCSGDMCWLKIYRGEEKK